MPLVSVQTKLTTVLALAQQLRGSCAYYVQRFGDGTPVLTSELVNAAKMLREISIRATPFIGDSAVSAEADRQFSGQPGWQAGSLLALIDAILPAVESAIAAAKEAVPSVVHSGQLAPVLATWAADGTTVAAQVSSASVQPLRAVCSAILNAIPE